MTRQLAAIAVGRPDTKRSVMGLPVGIDVLVSLVIVAFLAGIGITAIGPGGVFTTVALAGLTVLPRARSLERYM